MPYTLDPRYDPSTIKTKIRVPQQVGRPNLSPATTAQNIANERQFRGAGRDELHSAASGDVNSPAAKEIGRRAGVRLGVLPELSTADNAMVDGQMKAMTQEVKDNFSGLDRMAANNSAASANVQYPNSASPSYAPAPNNPELTQKVAPMTRARIGAMDDTAAWNSQAAKPSALTNTSEAFIVAPDGRIAVPGDQIPVVRHAAGAAPSGEAAAYLAEKANQTAFAPLPEPVVQANPPSALNRIGSAVSGKATQAGDYLNAVSGGALSDVAAIQAKAMLSKKGVAGTALGLYDTASNQVALNDQSTIPDRGAQAGEDLSRAAGATAGALAGGAIGSAVPIVGTAVGGVIGGALGYMAPGLAISGGRRLANRLGGGDWSDPGSPLEQQQNAGTADKTIGQRVLKGVNDFIENEKRDVPVKAGQSSSPEQSSEYSGGNGGGGEGWMTDNKGNKATWNPSTQQFEGTLANGKKLTGGPVNSAGKMFSVNQESQGMQPVGIGRQVEKGRGAILLDDTANDPYQKILKDPNVPDAVKAKLKLKMDMLAQGDRRTTIDERQQQFAQQIGEARLGMDAQGNAIDNEGKQLALKNNKRIQAIRDQLDTETDPILRQQLIDQYDLLTGNSGKFQVAQADTGIPDNLGGTIKQSVVVNNRTGAIAPIRIPGIGAIQEQKIDPKTGRTVIPNPKTGQLEYAN